MTDVDDAAAGRTANGEAMRERHKFSDTEKNLLWQLEHASGYTAQEISRKWGHPVRNVKQHLSSQKAEYARMSFLQERPRVEYIYRLAKRARALSRDMQLAGFRQHHLLPLDRLASCCERGTRYPVLGLRPLKGGRDQAHDATAREA